MIYQPNHIELMREIHPRKTETRRLSDIYQVGRVYSVQPGRGKKALSDIKVEIVDKWLDLRREDVTRITNSSKFRITNAKIDNELSEHFRFHEIWGCFIDRYGYPLSVFPFIPIDSVSAEREGGYDLNEYENVFADLFPDWNGHWRIAYKFKVRRLEKVPTDKTISNYTKNINKEGENR